MTELTPEREAFIRRYAATKYPATPPNVEHETARMCRELLSEVDRLRAQVATVREEALEEAARVCDAARIHGLAAAIRALRGEGNGEP